MIIKGKDLKITINGKTIDVGGNSEIQITKSDLFDENNNQDNSRLFDEEINKLDNKMQPYSAVFP